MRTIPLIAGLLLLGARQEATLDSVLDAMERRAAAVKDLRASFVYTVHEKDSRTKEIRPRVRGAGSLVVRGGDASWTEKTEERGSSFAPWLDLKKGFRAALDARELVIHAPARLEAPEDWGGQSDPMHHGASHFRSRYADAPHAVPLLAYQPWIHPVPFLFERAPRRYLGGLPKLKLGGKQDRDGRSYHVLTTIRDDESQAARVAEAKGGQHESWWGGEIWVDTQDFSIARIRFRYEASASGPPHAGEREFLFARRGEFNGVAGLPTVVTLGASELALTDVRVNEGVQEGEVRLEIPRGRIARDWNRRSPESYRKLLEKAPDDPSLWLSLGSILMRHQDYPGALEAFRKVIELRPDAEEGYIGMAFLFKEEKTLQAATEAVEKGAARAGSAWVHVALAHRYAKRGGPESARHFEEALKIRGEDPELLASMMALVSFEDPWPQYLRAFRAEARTGELTQAYGHWSRTPRPDAEREELARLYEEALREGERPDWVRGRIIELYRGMKRTGDARRHARAALETLEARAGRPGYGSYSQALEIFLSEKDFERARRIREAFARGEGRESQGLAARLEARIAAFENDLPGHLEYWDECLRREWRSDEKYSGSPRSGAFLWGLRDSGRVIPFAEALMERVGPDPDQQAAADLLDWITREHAFGTDWARLNAQLKERRSGKPATAADVLQVCNQFVADGKWKEGMARIREALKRSDLTPVQKARAEVLLARCAEGLGDRAGALDACERALEEPAVAAWTKREARLIRGRLLLAGGDGRRAALAYAAALREAVEAKDLDAEREILEQVRRHRGTALGDGTGDDPALKAVFALTVREPSKAADALGEVCRLWESDPFLLRELVRHCCEVLRMEEALAARERLTAVLVRLSASRARLPSRSEATSDIARAMIRQDDPVKMKAFAESLIGEPRWTDGFLSIRELLEAIGEEPYLEKAYADLLRVCANETDRFNARHLAARVWHALGRTEKAAALLREITEKQGWTPSSAEIARREIALMEGEAKGRAELFAAWRRRLSELKEAEDEVTVLERLVRDGERRREVWGLDALWKAAVRAEKPDPFLLKVGAMRATQRRDQLACVERLEALGQARPEWSLRRAFLLLDRGGDPKALETLAGLVRASAGDPARRDRLGRLLGENRWRLPRSGQLEVGRALAAAGAHRWAWEVVRDALQEPDEILLFAQKWRDAAAPGEERAGARLVVARTLLQLERPPEALAEAEAAAAEPGIVPLTRAQIGQLHLELLVRMGNSRDLSEALLRWLRVRRFAPEEVEAAFRTVSKAAPDRIGEVLKEWEQAARIEPASPGLVVFRARLEIRMGRFREALEVLEEGGRQFPREAWLLHDLGEARLHAGDFKGAAEAFEWLLGRGDGTQDEWTIHTRLARCYGKTGRVPEALEHLRALEGGPTWEEGLALLADEIGLHDEAVRHYRAALDRRGDSLVRFRLARALRASGRLAEAETELRTLLEAERGLGSAAAQELAALLPPEKAAALILEKVRSAKDLRSALLAFESLAGALPEGRRADLGRAWEKATEGAPADARVVLVSARIWRSWSRSPEKALEVVLAGARKLPGSVPVLLEAVQLLSQSGRHGEAGAVFETLASLDPEGKESGVPAARHRIAAFTSYLQAQDTPAVLRVGLEILGGEGAAEGERERVRRSLGRVAGTLGDRLWRELGQVRLPPLSRKAALEVGAQIELLSDDDIERRRAAADALIGYGSVALPALVSLVESTDLDVRTEARRIVRAILGP